MPWKQKVPIKKKATLIIQWLKNKIVHISCSNESHWQEMILNLKEAVIPRQSTQQCHKDECAPKKWGKERRVMLRLMSASPFLAQTLVKFPKEVMVLCCCQGTVISQLPWDQAGQADQRGQSPALSVQTLKTCAFLCASSHCGERDHHGSLLLSSPMECACLLCVSWRLMDQTVSPSYLL